MTSLQAIETQTTCPYCGVGCGVVATVDNAGQVAVRGDEQHPSNFGRLCSKGSALNETTDLDDRLLHPQVDGQRVSWDTALEETAARMRAIIDQHGPESVALYVSGQMLTEDYYVANKLVKGYLGTGNIDTNSRLCMSSAVVGHKRAFGADTVPGCYEDIEQADLVVITGSNLAWCHPIIYQRLIVAKQQRPELKIVVLDPRGTATCDMADMHLALKAGSDVALFNGLLKFLADEGKTDQDFVDQHTMQASEALQAADRYGLEQVADICGLGIAEVQGFYRLFSATEKTVTVFSQGVNQSTSGSDKVNSIINCHLLTGRIGRTGMGPFSITGQPNAMGGREVGGLANMLAAHMNLEDSEHRRIVQDFWSSPLIADSAGLKAVDLFDAMHEGKIKAVWIIATNPVVSLPNANKVREALERCELVVVSDVLCDTDTVRLGHIKLPATGWAEKDGTVTNSERRISRQRGFLPAPGEAKADWWMLCEVAKRLGFDGFEYQEPADIFDEHARLSATENDGVRAFDIGGLSGLSTQAYRDLEPIQWPVRDSRTTGTARLCADDFYTPDRKARFIPVNHKAPAHAPDGEFPFVLNTGRIRDQWHSMTRTGKSAKLGSHLPEPFAELHPRDALLCGVSDGTLSRIRSRWGDIVVRIKFSVETPRGSVFVPIHWNSLNASDARVGKLVNPAVDPLSGEPEFKHTPVTIEPFLVEWHAFVLSRRPINTHDFAYWARATGEQFLRYELAGRQRPQDWSAWGKQLLGAHADLDDYLEYADTTASLYRGALVVNERIEACVFVSPRLDLPSRQWLASVFAQDQLSELDRVSLLVGRPADPKADAGATVCSCFGVGRNVILHEIELQNLQTPEAIGQCLKAGTNCGSCVPELRKLIAEANAAV
ncbi:MAG: molybdopterin-dependent oxidoreductase [Oceanococcus sp.]